MSNTDQVLRRRLIVELWHGGADRGMLRAVAELAVLLDFDLHGLFIEDTALFALADLPFVRELRLPTHEWQKIEPARIAAELRHAAQAAQRLLRDAAAARGIASGFEVRRGEPAEALAAVAAGGDVIALAQPGSSGGQLASGAARVWIAAHASGASLLLLPAGVMPRHGLVAALCADGDDAALALAVRAAINTGETLLVLLPAGEHAAAERALRRCELLGLPRTRVATKPLAGLQAEDVLHALGHAHERLIVLAGDAFRAGTMAAAARLAAGRGAAVLALCAAPRP